MVCCKHCFLAAPVLALFFAHHLYAEGQAKRITYDHLAALGQLAWDLHDYRDNEWIYEEKVNQLKSYANLLQNAEMTFQVAVVRVTKLEVIYQASLADRTRVVVCKDQPDLRPGTELSRYRFYAGPPSTGRFNVLSAPTTFRIGEEIDLNVARGLRAGDVLEVKGIVNSLETRVPPEFHHDTIVYISNATVVRQDEELPQP